MGDLQQTSKLKLSYEILIFLYSKNYFTKAEELSEKFNLSNRSIRRIISDLRDLGYDIISQSGQYGGYKLNRSNIILPVTMTNLHKQAWLDIETTVKGSDLVNKDNALQLLDIIGLQSQLKTSIDTQVFSTKKLLDNVKAKIEAVYETLTFAINNKQRVEIKYKSLNKKPQKTTWQEFRPESFQVFNGTIYVKGYYDTTSESFRTLRLSRFEAIRLINKKYSFNDNFNEDNDNSAFSRSIYKLYHVVLKIDKGNHDLMDFKYGENQINQEFLDHFILEFDLAGDLLIKELVFSMGAYCRLLEPTSIREDIKKELKAMISKY
ncbi:MAG: WYL domain-containing protein [Erysipelothrix sp.]|nr:WYL domain-containing protein [Erysipelothrix sp.]